MSKPRGKIHLAWSPAFPYGIGLIVSDGNLSTDGRHILFTSKDRELAEHFIAAFDIPGQFIGKKARGGETEKKYFVVQFGDVLFYRFLVNIGLMQNKSRLLKKIRIPKDFFSHFLRGLFDGDGTFYSYWDPRWKSSFMYYTGIASASPIFLAWLKEKIHELYGISGHITSSKTQSVQQLKFAKKATVLLQKILYKDADRLYLRRKHLKISAALSIVSTPTDKTRGW